jgi:GT2 family glycosyltransferase
MLLRSGDLAGFARRVWRRLVGLWGALEGRDDPIDYGEWRNRWVDLTERDREVVAGWQSATRFAVSVGDGPPDAVAATVGSLGTQLHKQWAVGAEAEDADWVLDLEAGVVLHPAAMATIARVVDADPGLSLVYADYDHLDDGGRPTDPCFLPDWNPDLFDGLGRIGALVARHRTVPSEQVTGLDGAVVCHLPFVLASRPVRLRDADPVPVRHRWPVGDPPPRVSVVVPTRDRGRLLEACLTSLSDRTRYPDMEVVVVDHESSERRARRLIDGLAANPDTVVVPFTGPFNFAAMCNRGVAASSGEVVVLLNNDTEVVAADWLDEFVGQLARPEVGVVGALLLFGDGTIQHAGVHPGVGGLMGHGHKHRPGDDPGYHGRLTVAHEVAAVTGACLGTTRELWDHLGGLDEEHLAVAYNDIDLCLKARVAGLRVVLAPHAVLHHHESVSRGYDDDPTRRARLAGEVETMVERWGDFLDTDPAHSPNLARDGDGFTVAAEPRITPVWRNPTIASPLT